MKQMILAAMVMMTVAGSASATTNAWDYFWGTSIKNKFVELGNTLDPKLSGWDDFWFQCQDPNKTAGDCVGTVATGIAMVIGVPIVVGGTAILTAAAMPAAFTGMNPSAYGFIISQ